MVRGRNLFMKNQSSKKNSSVTSKLATGCSPAVSSSKAPVVRLGGTVSCQTLIFTRFFNGYHLLGIFPDLWGGMVAMILEKNLHSQVRAWGPASSGIPHGCCRSLGLSLVSFSAEQLKSPLQWMDEEDLCLTSAVEEFCPAYEPGVPTSCRAVL